MTATVLATIASIANPVSMLLAVLGKPQAWIVVIVTQLALLTYMVTEQQWGFAGQLGSLAIGIYGLWRWRTKGVHHQGREEREN